MLSPGDLARVLTFLLTWHWLSSKGTTKLLLWELWGRGQSAWQLPTLCLGCLDNSPFFFLWNGSASAAACTYVVPHPGSHVGTQHPSTGMAPADLRLECQAHCRPARHTLGSPGASHSAGRTEQNLPSFMHQCSPSTSIF